MEKFKTKKLLKPLPKVDYKDKELYSKYLRVQDIRKFVPLATGLITGTSGLASLFCGIGGFELPCAVYGCLGLISLSAGVFAYLSCCSKELLLKSGLLKEIAEEK